MAYEDKNGTNPLSALYSDTAGTIPAEQLAKVLAPFVTINKRLGKVLLSPEGHALKAKPKVVVRLLAQKARQVLGDVESEEMMPAELKAELKGMKAGTIDPTFKALADAGKIVKGEKGYFVPEKVFYEIAEDIENV